MAAFTTDIGNMLARMGIDEDEIAGMDTTEIGAMVQEAAKAVKNKVRGRRKVIASTNTGDGRTLDCPFSRASALAAAASTNITATPTRDGVCVRLVMFSSAHDDVSLTAASVAGRPQLIGQALAPAPIVRFYRDSFDSFPISWDNIVASQDIVLTVKNEHAATATNVAATIELESVN